MKTRISQLTLQALRHLRRCDQRLLGATRHGCPLVSLFTGLTFFAVLAADRASHTVKVEPTESDELLANPGMGWQTFHRFADDDPNLQGLPSASAG